MVRGDTRQYLDRHPGPEDVAIVIEVSDTTLGRDRTIKKRTYARAGIPVYWIVNLVEGQVEVYDRPSGDSEQPDYGQMLIYGRSAVLLLVIEGIAIGAIDVDTILP